MSERNLTLDASKSIAIILVILGHAIVQGYEQPKEILAFNVIYAFHMPLFFIVSGILIENKDKIITIENLVIRLKRLVLPSLLWHSIYTVAFSDITKITSDFSGFYLSHIKNPDSPWFLMILFGSSVLVLSYRTFVAKKYFYLAFGFFSLVVVFLLININNGKITWIHSPLIVRSLYYSLFIVVGIVISKHEVLFEKKELVVLWLAIFVIVFYALDMNKSYYHYLCRSLLLGVSGTLLVLTVSCQLSHAKLLSFMFQWLGRRTLQVYLLNGLFFKAGFLSGNLKVISCFLFNIILIFSFLSIFEILSKKYNVMQYIYNISFGQRSKA